MQKNIKFNKYFFSEDEKNELIDTLESGWITTGPKTQRFEEQFAEYMQAKYAVGVTSGTAALHLSLAVLEIGSGDEVITTPMTFAATVNVIVQQGAKPVLVDVRKDTLNIDPQKIEDKITKNTKAIIPVHYAGQPCDMDEILSIARKYGLYIIEDAAHALETEYKGKKIGSIGDLTCFSFHPIKNITTGEGGMVTTNDRELADKIRMLRLHGMDKSAWTRYDKGKFRNWDIFSPGYKYNMTDIQASLGIHQLKKIDGFWEKRREYTEQYNYLLRDEDNINLLPDSNNNKCAYHLYPVRIKTENLSINRNEFIDSLQANGIGAAVHFSAIHHLSLYRDYFKFNEEPYPNVAYASERLVSLPLYPKLTKDDVEYVANMVKYICLQHKTFPN